MNLRTLGGLELVGSRFTQPKPLLLLAYLALEGPQTRAFLAELFWPQGESRKSLSMALTRLHGVHPGLVRADGQRVWTDVESDAKELLGALERRDWSGAAGRYRDAFLTGAALGDLGAELEGWVYATREFLAERVQYGLLELAEAAAKGGRFGEAGALAERAYRLPGLSGSDPAALRRLYGLLCAAQSPLAPSVRKEAEEYGVRLTLSSAEARAGFGRDAGVPPLPVRGTTFVGRGEELAALGTLLAEPQVALVTLFGPAGVGKTRLALGVAHEGRRLDAFPDGVYFAPLDALADPALLVPTLLGHLGLSPRAGTEPFAQLADALAERRVLLVLDNFEGLVGLRGVLSDLLGRCPNLKLLVTSRERLRLEEEHVFPLSGLPYAGSDTAEADAAGAETGDAVQLFRERARRVAPGFNVRASLPDVLRVCRLVEGLPLGLELAAGWANVMPCAEIAAEISRNLDFLSAANHNVPARHRSLRAAFETSWRRLSVNEQEVLAKLAVFRGGFRREAAATVSGATLPLLALLVDKSLLRVLPDGRYDRHPLLYSFTQEKLAGRPEVERQTKALHAAFYLTLAEEAEPHLRRVEQVRWFERLSVEQENFRAAFSYLEGDTEAALRLGAALGYFWKTRGFYEEGLARLTTLLEGSGRDDAVTARAHLRAGELAWPQGDHGRAWALFEKSLEVAAGLGNRSLMAQALLNQGLICERNRAQPERARVLYSAALGHARAAGDRATEGDLLRLMGTLHLESAAYGEARACYERSAALMAELGDRQGEAKALVSLATVLTYLGDLGAAHRLNERCLDLFRSVGDAHGEGIALLNLGADAEGRGDAEASAAHYRRSLELFRRLGDRRMVSHLLNNVAGALEKDPRATPDTLYEALGLLDESLTVQRTVGDASLTAHALLLSGHVLCDLGDAEAAGERYASCLKLCRETGDAWALMRVLGALGRWRHARGDADGARAALGEALTLARTSGDRKTLGQTLEAQAHVAFAAGNDALAAELLAQAESLRQRYGFRRTPRRQLEFDTLLGGLRERLGEPRFAELWSGALEGLEQAV